mmetsp:Transcript_40455/g.130053  ORF Transcript_40455/g.130053 Transcript_40455/m.130053 type:complete len:279 (+) Transcript_40455:283-1119(+)
MALLAPLPRAGDLHAALRPHSLRLSIPSSWPSSLTVSFLLSTLPCWSSLSVSPPLTRSSSSSICRTFFLSALIFLPTSTSPTASHLAISATIRSLDATFAVWSGLSVAPFAFRSSSSSTCRSRLRSALSFRSTSLASPPPSVSPAPPAPAAGVSPAAPTAGAVAPRPAVGVASRSSPSSWRSASTSFFFRAASFLRLFFAAVLLSGLAAAPYSMPGMPAGCDSSFHWSEYLACSSGGTYPSRTRTAGLRVPSGRLLRTSVVIVLTGHRGGRTLRRTAP